MDNWEIYYRTHAKGVGKELTGSPPLTFVSNGENIVDYRIDGASGGVGDKTANLLDKNHNTIPNAILDAGGIYVAGEIGGYLIYAPITPLQTYTFCTNGTIRLGLRSAFMVNKPALSGSYVIDGVNTHQNHGTDNEFTRQAPLTANWIVIQIRDESALAYDNMLNDGSTALPYEPYGYKIPVVCGGRTTNIYLDEPLGENESISMSDTGVSIPTINGTNILAVDTEVQPSNMYIKYSNGGNINQSLMTYLEYKYNVAKE